MNLQELLRVPDIGIFKIREALAPYFVDLLVEERGEPFFTHHLRCIDREGRTRLLIRFGWSERRQQWDYEVLPQRRRKNRWATD